MDRTETIRLDILTQLYGLRFSLSDAERMALRARRDAGLADARASEFEREAAYLANKGLIELDPDDISQGHKRWRISAAGCDYLESRGLV